MKKYSQILKCCILLSILFVDISFSNEGTKKSVINVSIHKNFISLEANNAKLEDIFYLISKKMKINYKIYAEMKDKIISTSFKNLNINDAIKQIIGDNYAVVYSDKEGKIIEKIYVLYKGKDNKRLQLIKSFYKDIFPDKKQLQNVVEKRINSKYPNSELYSILPHHDLDNQLKSYVFCFYVGTGQPPNRDELNTQILQAWNKKKIAMRDIQEGYKRKNSEIMSKAAITSKKASLGISRENDFLSIEIGANYESPPIIASWKGLPFDISQYIRATEVANKALPDKNPEFVKTYTTGLLSIIFSFKGNDNKIYYVNPENWRVFTKWKKAHMKNDSNKNNVKDLNKKKWSDFLDI